MMMTNGEHDELWRSGAKAIISCETDLENIHRDLKRFTLLQINIEMYSLGSIDKNEYAERLQQLMDSMN